MSGNYRPRRRPGAPGPRRARNAAEEPVKRDTGRRARPARPADPRRTAYDVLAAVRDREAYANLLLPRLLAERGLAGRDAALATELAYGTLRGRGTYDAVLAACSDRSLDKLDPPVLDVLRLGAHQLLSTRVGAHAAVATSVDLAKSVIGPRVSGYVNAVLRRVATRDLPAWLDIVAPDPATDRDGYLAVRYSHPRWIVAAYRDALGDAADEPAHATFIPAAPPKPEPPAAETSAAEQPAAAENTAGIPAAGTSAAPSGAAEQTGEAEVTELAAALAAGNARPRVTLATFPSGPPREAVMPADAEPGRWSPYAFTLKSGNPAPLIESGAAAVQDEGSQLAAIALARTPVTPRTGQHKNQNQDQEEAERWLDMCAGPGGKSRMLYGLAADSGATLVAAELHPHRAALVADALSRAARPGMPLPEVIVADGTHPAWSDGTFDRVLVDVPCSGLGALRRRPEARWRKSEADLKELTALQRDLLRSALAAVRPGGVVGYVTCSPVPAETRDVVTDVAASVPGVEILDAPAVLSNVPDTQAANPLFAQLWPHRHDTDALFIALLRRNPLAEPTAGQVPPPQRCLRAAVTWRWRWRDGGRRCRRRLPHCEAAQ
jgi:16S rRNA (cytosine967-C5)-methyltransferase